MRIDPDEKSNDISAAFVFPVHVLWILHVDMFFICVRFPNPDNLCYMNSSLQGLLTLKDFIRDLSQQQEVWSHLPEAEIIRYTLTHILGFVLCGVCIFFFSILFGCSTQYNINIYYPSALCRRFMNIVGCHRSADPTLKLWALLLFKKALSVGAPEFRSNHQKVSPPPCFSMFHLLLICLCV